MALSNPSGATHLPQLFTRENIHTLPFPATDDGEYARRYLIPLMTGDPQKYIRNVHNTQLMAVKVRETIIPITITDFHPQNTYTVSPYSHYVSYGAFEEVKHLNNKLAEIAVKLVMTPVSWYFRYAELDKVVFVNNYLLSTNLYPPINSNQLSALSEALIKWFPDRAIVFRSVDQKKKSAYLSNIGRIGLRLGSQPSSLVHGPGCGVEDTSMQGRCARAEKGEL